MKVKQIILAVLLSVGMLSTFVPTTSAAGCTGGATAIAPYKSGSGRAVVFSGSVSGCPVNGTWTINAYERGTWIGRLVSWDDNGGGDYGSLYITCSAGSSRMFQTLVSTSSSNDTEIGYVSMNC